MANGDDIEKEIAEIAAAITQLEEELLTEMDEALKAAGLWKGKRLDSIRELVQSILRRKGKS
ncbi:MAG: hypothetical protein CME17_04045 [Gemmatimonadetes bacterium]|nr:hypothetical protein [Gemmatimonadota bacterium]|tara:strand:+ start:266 stop:451 length:186 start_codon:yes stop_codon:yes gene_type:complete